MLIFNKEYIMDENQALPKQADQTGTDRRDFLKKGAIVAGAALLGPALLGASLKTPAAMAAEQPQEGEEVCQDRKSVV